MAVPEPWRLTVRLGTIPSLAIALSLFGGLPGGLDRQGYFVGRDFVIFWTAGRLAATGLLDQIYDLGAFQAAMRALFTPVQPFMNFSYPPTGLLVLAPLARLPYGASYLLWQGAGIACFLATLLGGKAGPRRAGLVPWLLLSPIVVLEVAIGQAGFFFAALVVGAMRRLDRQPLLAGAMIGLISVKPQLGLLFPLVLIARQRWDAFAAAAVTTLGLIGLSLLAFGPEPWRAYLAVTLPFQGEVITGMDGFYTTLMTTPYAGLWWVGVPVPAALAVQGAVSLIVAGGVAWLVRRDPARPDGPEGAAGLHAALVAAGCILVTPYCLSYDLAIPITAALAWRLRCPAPPPRAVDLALLALFLVPLLGMIVVATRLPLLPLAAAAAFAALAAEAYRAAPPASRPPRSGRPLAGRLPVG
ncbi:glycosyltransferase family 87 protein [Methylobacterium sp. WSM2598]|uniref:glycosyltransferase family 87 protein n=1 Tax=Methylobacterium sp. WSM2598 TaxID=398261 RepID=UPI000378895A|nr:glycosyltransferase family 87 protein [Methylobacterium sp. WSM2598]